MKTSNQNKTSKRHAKSNRAHSVSLSRWLGRIKENEEIAKDLINQAIRAILESETSELFSDEENILETKYCLCKTLIEINKTIEKK
jgi:hypothetical protein